MTPPAILAAEKQRRLCLSPDHVACSTYLAAIDQTGVVEPSPATRDDRRPARPVARTAPLVLDHGRLAISMPGLNVERGAGQGGLVALMAVAFAAIVVARLSGGGPGLTPAQVGGGASASPSVAASRAPATSQAPVASQPGAGSAGPTVTLVPTEVEPTPQPPGATPAPAATTYTVRSGDTLGGIAREFGTTVKVLQELNGIENPRALRVGQVLQLP